MSLQDRILERVPVILAITAFWFVVAMILISFYPESQHDILQLLFWNFVFTSLFGLLRRNPPAKKPPVD